MSFASLGLSPRVLAGLSRLGYATPTPVQAAVIPDALQGRDVLARAQTGTGKTAAFGLPMIERLAEVIGTSPRPRGLVLVPTRELALQVQEALRGFAQATRLRTMTHGRRRSHHGRRCARCAAVSTSSSPRPAGSSITSTGGPSTCRRSRS